MVRLRILNKYQWNNDQIIDQNQITGIVTYKGHVVQDPNQKVAIKEFSKEELGEIAFNEIYANQVLQYDNHMYWSPERVAKQLIFKSFMFRHYAISVDDLKTLPY